ncbi:MAG TPA: LuxR C-terminal-related transcriptional regulator [Gaiellaceae bacterium]|nr:LuxR C-terminal-related transcriptional regulator [Gaiellaceae bacterium]
MASTAVQQGGVRRERRIIERPRLIKMLDESEARVILLLAPAGYGKTTLARQWVKTLSGAIWVSATPAHRDVVTLAEDLATGVDALGGNASKFIREYLSAQSNPQRSARGVAAALADQINKQKVQWIVIDDYHELSALPETEQVIQVLQQATSARFLFASRQRPSWARSRQIVYGELSEIGRDHLAMTDAESAQMLGRRTELDTLVTQAEGWPAVLALAAAAKDPSPTPGILPIALHRYLAEELFQATSDSVRHRLLRLALLPELTRRAVEEHVQADFDDFLSEARELGFISGDETPDLHPLLREFLLQKLTESPDAEQEARDAITYCVELGRWDNALNLIGRFGLTDLVEPVLRQAFKPLARSGRVGSLSAFAEAVRTSPEFPPPAVDVIGAEVALRDGQLTLAQDLAQRVRSQLSERDPLRSRASTIAGHSFFLSAFFPEAEQSFSDARATAMDEHDENEALHGLALARIFGEQPHSEEVVEQLFSRRHRSPTHLLRAATAELARRRFGPGIADDLWLDEPLNALPLVEDPRARTAFTYAAAYTLAQKAQYRQARELVDRFAADADAFDLEFAKPHAAWTGALIQLGLRRFGETERLLQAVEDRAAASQSVSHTCNARILRARLRLETGRVDDALHLTNEPPPHRLIPSWRAEHVATRALALACSGQAALAEQASAQAMSISHAAEVTVLAEAARATSAALDGDVRRAAEVLRLARKLGAWDPVVCALRSSATLAGTLAKDDYSRTILEPLYATSGDHVLARRAGFRTRSTRTPLEILSPRELEILGLISEGMRTKDIANALFISQSTTKVHVRNMLAKLGAHNRAEAVARYEMFKEST